MPRPSVPYRSFLLLFALGCSSKDPQAQLDASAVQGHDAAVSLEDAAFGDADPDAGITAADGGDAGALDAGPELDILEALRAVPGLRVEETSAGSRGTRAFFLWLEQPEDHTAPAGAPHFEQRMVLIHRAEGAPMVLHTTGYDLFGDPSMWAATWMEPAQILGANQLTVEHRFFGESVTTAPDWTKLNIAQSAADSHHIKEALSAIYRGDWIGTGVSKGGMTAIFHHFAYPNDLSAIMPYVAPISFGSPDHRYVGWLAGIGPPDGGCRNRILDMKVELCQRRAEAARFVATQGGTFGWTQEALEAAVASATFGYHWLYWQYYSSPEVCSSLPERGLPIGDLFSWFPFDLASYREPVHFDPGLGAYVYQAYAELGEPEVVDPELATLTSTIDFGLLPTPTIDPDPWGPRPAYDPAPMQAVDHFLRTEARHVLAVYGAWDAWTGGQINVDPALDNAVHLAPGKHHDAQLADLPRTERAQAIAQLQGWLHHPLRGNGPTIDLEADGEDQRRVSALVLTRELQGRRRLSRH